MNRSVESLNNNNNIGYKSTDFGSKDMYKQSSCDHSMGHSLTNVMRNQVVNLEQNMSSNMKTRNQIMFDTQHLNKFISNSKFANRN